MTTLEDLAAHASGAGLFLDFDGTLSPIVSRPEDARPAVEVPDLLQRLGERLAVVAIVSGRSAHQLLDWLGSGVEVWGLHGAERTVNGRVEVADAVDPYLPAIHAARDEAQAWMEASPVFDGCIVEDKGAILALHLRTAREPIAAGRALEKLAQTLARKHQLVVGTGRMVFELKPPGDISKAQVVRDRARGSGLSHACFVGDDRVDVPAFEALDELQASGLVCLRVAVNSDEAPAELLDRADLIVEGVPGVVGFLSELELLTRGQ